MTSIDHIDLNLLRVFQAIGRERSLTKAGERLALSQPAVGYFPLGRLRTLFDDPLFIRTRAGMHRRPLRWNSADIVGRALDTVRQALRYAERFDPATSTRTFRLSLSDAGEMAYLPALCRAPESRAARSSWYRADAREEMEQALRSSRLDFAIGNLPLLLPRTAMVAVRGIVCHRMTRNRPDLPRGNELKLERSSWTASHVVASSARAQSSCARRRAAFAGVGRNVALVLPHFVACAWRARCNGLRWRRCRSGSRISLNRGDAFRIYLRCRCAVPKAPSRWHWVSSIFNDDEGIVWMRSHHRHPAGFTKM